MAAQETTSEHAAIDPTLDLRLLRLRSRPDAEDPAMIALELARAGRADDAIEVVDEALARDPEDVDLLLGCGLAAMGAGQLAFAQLVLTRAAMADRSWTEPMRHLVVVLERRGRADRALQVARHAVAAGERDPGLIARVLADDARRALDARVRAYREDPDRDEPSLLAQELAAQGRWDDALSIALSAIESEDDADLRVIEARARTVRGEHDQAERALERAIELAPSWAEPARMLADHRFEQGAMLPALATIERILAVHPEDASLGASRDRILEAMARAGIARPGVADAQLDALLGELDRIDPIGDDTRAGFARGEDTLRDVPTELTRRRTGWLPTIARSLFGGARPSERAATARKVVARA